MNINEILDKIQPINTSSKLKLIEHFEEITLPKNMLIISSDKVEKNIYFINKGIARTFSNFDDREVTIAFGEEGDSIISLKSYILNQKGYENIELLEECKLYKISVTRLQNLFLTDIDIANWGRKFAEQELIKAERRFISNQLGTAKERYMELINKHPSLIQRVPLGLIASYLGITQVSLSRIRANIT